MTGLIFKLNCRSDKFAFKINEGFISWWGGVCYMFRYSRDTTYRHSNKVAKRDGTLIFGRKL